MTKLCSLTLMFVGLSVGTSTCLADDLLDREPLVAALIDAAKDAEENVRYAAFDALKSQPRSDELLELHWSGLEDESPRIRSLALERIVELEGATDKVIKLLLSLSSEPTNIDEVRVRKAVQSHLKSLGAPAIPYLLEAIKSGEVSPLIVSLLGQIPLDKHGPAVAKQLAVLLKHENASVRFNAVQSLQTILAADAKAKVMEQVLRSPNPPDPRFVEYYARFIQRYDSDGDGSLNKEEWSRMAKDPVAADIDGDGQISVVEFTKWSMSQKLDRN